MSFGRPPSIGDSFKVAPPQRGSFPLDHDGDCKAPMMAYLACLRAHKNDNGQCRHLSRKYLECRMDNNLMDRDDMQNLGLGDVGDPKGEGAMKERTSAVQDNMPGGSGGGGR